MALELKREEIISELALATERFEALIRAIKPDKTTLLVEGLDGMSAKRQPIENL